MRPPLLSKIRQTPAGKRHTERQRRRLKLFSLLSILALITSPIIVAYYREGSVAVALAPEVIPGERASLAKPPAIRPAQNSLVTTPPPPSNLKLRPVELAWNPDGRAVLKRLPKFDSPYRGKFAGKSAEGDLVVYSIDPALQSFTEDLVRKSRAPHIAIVAMQPTTGQLLAVADRSVAIPDLATHVGFPAASLFKIITSAAALERARLSPGSVIPFRGGTYTLNRWNYQPNTKADKRRMSLAEALGKSCNPVFARVALKHLSAPELSAYAEAFGFNSPLFGDLLLPPSRAFIPRDQFLLARTAAGFGDVKISPIHAAALISSLANGGVLASPSLVDSVISPRGATLYRAQHTRTKRVVGGATARQLLSMMHTTTTIGTSRKAFSSRKRAILPGVRVAAKTGTLTGDNPRGLNNWFIAAAPIERPRIAVAVIVVDHRDGLSASHLGRMVIERALTGRSAR